MRRPLGLAASAALVLGLSASSGCAARVLGPTATARSSARASTTRPFSPGDVVAYTISNASGAVIGRVHSVFSIDGGGARQVRTRITLAPLWGASLAKQGASGLELVTTLREDLSPVSFERRSSLDGRFEIRFGDRVATLITGEGARDVPYPRAAAWFIPRHDLMLLALGIGRADLVPGTAMSMDVVSASTATVEVESVRVERERDGRTAVRFVAGTAVLDGRGTVTKFEEAGTGWVFEREDPPGAPPPVELATAPSRYARPADASFTDREISIAVEEGTLAGTLSEPRYDVDATAAPGVVFLSDVGPQDRNGIGRGLNQGTWQLLDHLSESGFAVLRLDDRGVGGSTSRLRPEEVGLDTLVDDATRAVKYLSAQPGVDPKRIFVIGHGEGGLVALRLATQVDLSGLALLATPLRSRPSLIAARSAEETGKKLEETERDVRLAISALSGDEAARAQAPRSLVVELATERQLMIDQSNLDVSRLLGKVRAEVALFQGMKDFEVSWREDAKPLADLLKKHKRNAKLFVYENVDHWLKEEQGVSTMRRYLDGNRRLDARVLEDLTAWLAARARGRTTLPAVKGS